MRENTLDYSIIVPTYNSGKFIRECMQHIFASDYPRDKYEIILVDGGSCDNTLDIARECGDVTIMHSTNQSISNSRNIGAMNARGENFLFLDSDCLMDRRFLSRAREHLNKYQCYGAFYRPPDNSGWVTKAWLVSEGKEEGIVDWITAGTLAVSSEVFREIGGFNEQLATGEDMELCQRIRKSGYTIYNDPTVGSMHLGQADSIFDFFKKEVWRGKSMLKSLRMNLSQNIYPIYPFAIIIYSFTLFAFIVSLLINSIFMMGISFLLLVGMPTVLALKKSVQTGQYSLMIQFLVLWFIYLLARSYSLIKFRQYRDLL